MSKLDFPFEEVVRSAEQKIEEGYTIFQKFTCVGCGQRLAMDVPNTFYETGGCDKCNVITNIKHNGCNYLAYARSNPMKIGERK